MAINADATDAELIEAIRNGDINSRNTLIARYDSILHKIVSGYSLPEVDLQDIITEIWITAFRSIEQVSTDIHIKPWLHVITQGVITSIPPSRAQQVHRYPEELDTLHPSEIIAQNEAWDHWQQAGTQATDAAHEHLRAQGVNIVYAKDGAICEEEPDGTVKVIRKFMGEEAKNLGTQGSPPEEQTRFEKALEENKTVSKRSVER